jgi:hypothetical protein
LQTGPKFSPDARDLGVGTERNFDPQCWDQVSSNPRSQYRSAVIVFLDREKEAFAILRIINYLERELRVSLNDEHLADLCNLMAEDVMRKHIHVTEDKAETRKTSRTFS